MTVPWQGKGAKPQYAAALAAVCTPLQRLQVVRGGRLEVCIGAFQAPHAVLQQSDLPPQLGLVTLPPLLRSLHPCLWLSVLVFTHGSLGHCHQVASIQSPQLYGV